MTIFGGGFSEDVFNFGKPNHGNKVYLLINYSFNNDYLKLGGKLTL